MSSRMMKPRISIPLEYQEQRWLVKWIKCHHLIKEYVIKTNNEGVRSPQQGRMLKLMGMCVGASDLLIAYPNRNRTKAGLWLEVKRNMVYPPSAKRSASWIAEEMFIERMKIVGFDGKICYGWIDGKKIIEDYLVS